MISVRNVADYSQFYVNRKLITSHVSYECLKISLTLALNVWEMGRDCETLKELSTRFGQSDVAAFEFPAELVYDLWGVVDDWRAGRLRPRPTAVVRPFNH